MEMLKSNGVANKENIIPIQNARIEWNCVRKFGYIGLFYISNQEVMNVLFIGTGYKLICNELTSIGASHKRHESIINILYLLKKRFGNKRACCKDTIRQLTSICACIFCYIINIYYFCKVFLFWIKYVQLVYMNYVWMSIVTNTYYHESSIEIEYNVVLHKQFAFMLFRTQILAAHCTSI